MQLYIHHISHILQLITTHRSVSWNSAPIYAEYNMYNYTLSRYMTWLGLDMKATWSGLRKKMLFELK